MDQFTKSLHEVVDAKIFGNKSGNLSRLLRAKFNVLPGLAVPSKYMLDNKDIAKLDLLIPKGPYIVRSSSLYEDGELSYAGLNKSIGPVEKQELNKTIKEVQESSGNYDYGNISETSIPSLIQPYMLFEKGGVCFTANPITNNLDELVIESGSGPQAIVDGTIIPDSLIIKKSEVQNHFASIFLDIERYFGRPQDIEWGIKKGQMYILQSRDITTLKTSTKELEDIKWI